MAGQEAAGGAGGFAAATGDEPVPEISSEAREAEVRAAFEGMMQIRLMTYRGPGDPLAAPAEWERRRPVRAVALALEAAGITPSAVDASGQRVGTGFRVHAAERPGVVRVEWLGPVGSGAALTEEEALSGCARALERLGWEALLYRGPRRRRYLEVEAV